MSFLLRTSCISAVILLSTLFGIDYARANFLAITVATEPNDGYQRFIRSAKTFDIATETLGLGQTWKGGDMTGTGGGQKIRLLRDSMEKYKERSDMFVMFVDSYDVVFMNSSDEIVRKFMKTGAKILFSAEYFCWPDRSLADSYPPVGPNEKRFLNSGGFVGYADAVYKLVSHSPVADTDDDQLYYTKLFLDTQVRKELGMKLDTTSDIFIALNGALTEVTVNYKNGLGYLYSVKSGSVPVVAHGNGPIKAEFNSLTNYLGKAWNPVDGCQHCSEERFNLDSLKRDEYPQVLAAIFVEYPTPFLEEFLNKFAALTYPKQRMRVVIHSLSTKQESILTAFKDAHKDKYASLSVLGRSDFPDEHDARNGVLAMCQADPKCDFYFSVDGVVQITDPGLLQKLMGHNRSIVAPLLVRPFKLWSNFWGALSQDGFYARSDDYVDLVERRRKGLWNVPFMSAAYLVQRKHIAKLVGSYEDDVGSDPDMAFARRARDHNIFMFLLNSEEYGHLVDPDGYPTTHLNNDLYSIFTNPLDWEQKYIHENYSRSIDYDTDLSDIAQPCPDVFWVPLMSDRFCQDLINEMEHFGQWSEGKNADPRLEGGYENVPTRDIHMRQVGWEEHWMEVLRKYVHPIQRKVFAGYEDEPSARMNFVVRYKPTEQASLRPHHDASSYTVNMALNRRGIDYQGGGARFIRYNCSVIDTRVGWAMLHPGRVTHLHEGLTTTAGTRYIFITFVNP